MVDWDVWHSLSWHCWLLGLCCTILQVLMYRSASIRHMAFAKSRLSEVLPAHNDVDQLEAGHPQQGCMRTRINSHTHFYVHAAVR